MQLFAQLKISQLPPTREVGPVVKVEPVKDPIKDPPPPLPPVEDLGAGQRMAGKGLVYGGAGVAVLGGILATVGCGVGCAVTPTSQGSVPAGQLEALRTGQTLTTVGLVSLGVGGVAAGIGALLWATAAPAPVASVTVLPVAGGGVVQLGGRF